MNSIIPSISSTIVNAQQENQILNLLDEELINIKQKINSDKRIVENEKSYSFTQNYDNFKNIENKFYEYNETSNQNYSNCPNSIRDNKDIEETIIYPKNLNQKNSCFEENEKHLDCKNNIKNYNRNYEIKSLDFEKNRKNPFICETNKNILISNNNEIPNNKFTYTTKNNYFKNQSNDFQEDQGIKYSLYDDNIKKSSKRIEPNILESNREQKSIPHIELMTNNPKLYNDLNLGEENKINYFGTSNYITNLVEKTEGIFKGKNYFSGTTIRKTKEDIWKESLEKLVNEISLNKDKLKKEKLSNEFMKKKIKEIKQKEEKINYLERMRDKLEETRNVCQIQLQESSNIRREQVKLIAKLKQEIEIMRKHINTK